MTALTPEARARIVVVLKRWGKAGAVLLGVTFWLLVLAIWASDGRWGLTALLTGLASVVCFVCSLVLSTALDRDASAAARPPEGR